MIISYLIDFACSSGVTRSISFSSMRIKRVKEAIHSRDYEYEALTMMKLVKILRREIFEWSSFNFAGSFPCDCQSNSVPSTLKLFTSLLLNGCNMKSPNVN